MKKNYEIFDAYETNAAGVWCFVPCRGKFERGKPCKGFGCIKYAEGSVYTGEIFYDGKNFNKLGYGQQDFSRSVIGCLISEIGEKKYKFAGRYDYRKTDWIYGNGVLYYTYADGKPSHFVKGFFKGLDKVGEYEGEFDYSLLLEGYTAEMEFNYDENAGRIEERWRQILSKAEEVRNIKVLFLGDSYFELSDNAEFAGKNLFKNRFPKSYVNAGIGGSKFSDWIGWAEKIMLLPAAENIVINLGFNDLHSGATPEKTYRDFLKLLKILREYFPNAKFYLISVVHSPNCANYLEEENAYNQKIEKNATLNNVTVIEWNSLIKASDKNCFHADAVHPDENGYALFGDFIEEFLDIRNKL